MLDARGGGRIGWVLPALMLLTGSCGSSETPRWQGLKSVHVTVSRRGLPPPGGKPSTTSFLPGHGVQRAQSALNRYGIAPLAQPRTNTGCAGGYDVVIRIVKQDSSVVNMSAYRCGNTTYGAIGGDLPGFLTAVGISIP